MLLPLKMEKRPKKMGGFKKLEKEMDLPLEPPGRNDVLLTTWF